jgi:hypothetical protein
MTNVIIRNLKHFENLKSKEGFYTSDENTKDFNGKQPKDYFD